MARLTKAQQARIEADLKLAAFDAGVTSPPFPGALNRDEALRRCRSLLEEGVALTKTQVDFASLQWRLGAATELDVYESRILHAKAVSRLAAWDSGLLDFAVQAANWQPEPRASEQWPRPQLDIRKDILRTEDELRKLVDKPSETATHYAQRRLQYELKVLQLEMDAASK